MTGAYLRVKRNGKYQNVELEYLTSDEIVELFSTRDTIELIKWLEFAIIQLRGIAEIIDNRPEIR